MSSLSSFLLLAHILGMILAVGSATTKLALLFKSKKDPNYLPVFIGADKQITKLIFSGLVIVTLSGIGWLFLGYPFTTLLIIKTTLVAVVWVVGPVIDNVVSPRYRKLAPNKNEEPSPEFLSVQKQYLILEVFATGLFWVVVSLWVLLG
ncbi:MAG: hypothetical protein K9K86_06310 [Pseudomonadales bacterium]|nr:hypothetical protein [Pseudomonadales bacterium]